MDYQALQTLESVIRNQNFERAAQELFISQPAISQRLNQVEAFYGQRLLIRELPYRATELGERLLAHHRKVLSLEQGLNLGASKVQDHKTSVRISLNVDSLGIWFRRVLEDATIAKLVDLEIFIDDEKYTLDYLKSGRVDASIGINKTPISNHECHHLGTMTYVLVGNPEFLETFSPRLKQGFDFSRESAIVFNDRDDLHTQYLKKNFGYSGSYPKTSIPSIEGIKAALVSGFGYGLQPLMDIQKELKSKKLVLLDRAHTFERQLYLHHWNYLTPDMRKLIDKIRKAAEEII